MLWAPVVAWEISAPPTTPRGRSRSCSDGLTTLMGATQSRTGHSAEHAARDVQRLAVHVVRPRRAEEEDRAGGLLRRRGAADGDHHRRHPAHLLGDAELDLLAADLHRVVVDLGLREARVHEAEGDRVDVDLELAPLLGQRLGEADDARLAGRVIRLPRVAEGARG